MLVLAEAVQLLALVRGEALLQAVVAVARSGVKALGPATRSWASSARSSAPSAVRRSWDLALGIDLDGQCADRHSAPRRPGDLDGALGHLRLVEERAGEAFEDRAAQARADPDRVRAQGRCGRSPDGRSLQRAVPLTERADGREDCARLTAP